MIDRNGYGEDSSDTLLLMLGFLASSHFRILYFSRCDTVPDGARDEAHDTRNDDQRLHIVLKHQRVSVWGYRGRTCTTAFVSARNTSVDMTNIVGAANRRVENVRRRTEARKGNARTHPAPTKGAVVADGEASGVGRADPARLVPRPFNSRTR
jgi:hypothetical protein